MFGSDCLAALFKLISERLYRSDKALPTEASRGMSSGSSSSSTTAAAASGGSMNTARQSTFPLVDLPRDVLTTAMGLLGARDLARAGTASRFLFLVAREVQRRPELTVEVGTPKEVLLSLRHRLVATPTMGFLFGIGDLSAPDVHGALSQHLPVGCQVIGATAPMSLQALAPPEAGGSATELRHVSDGNQIALMLGSFPDAVVRAFHLPVSLCTALACASSAAAAVRLLAKHDLPAGDEWKTIVLIPAAGRRESSGHVGGLVKMYQRCCKNAPQPQPQSQPQLSRLHQARVMAMAAAATAVDSVVVDWSQLEAGENLSEQIAQAYGEGSTGILVVRGVPGAADLRSRLLPQARKLAKLSPEALLALERPEASHCLGWSHGKESFKGVPDLAKGSFYANPLYDDPSMGDDEVRAKYPFAASQNAWPEALPDLEGAFKDMGKLLRDVARLILQQCDAMVLSKAGLSARLTETTFDRSRMALGRLLHYFPLDENSETVKLGGSWCGWHNDNSTITGLVPAMWLDDATGESLTAPPSETGLYVQSRGGKVAKVSMPGDCLAFQVGEAAQILSGGVLRATPHHVRGHVSKVGEAMISRETFACFFEPQWDEEIGPPEGGSLEGIFRDEESELIPPLSKRFRPDPVSKKVEFGKLLGDSFQEYYKHNS